MVKPTATIIHVYIHTHHHYTLITSVHIITTIHSSQLYTHHQRAQLYTQYTPGDYCLVSLATRIRKRYQIFQLPSKINMELCKGINAYIIILMMVIARQYIPSSSFWWIALYTYTVELQIVMCSTRF